MARNKSQFRKVSRYVWRDPRFKKAGTDSQLLFLHLWTGPSGNAIGIINATPATIAPGLGWDTKRAEDAINSLSAVELADVDPDAEVVALDLLEFEPPDSSKVVTHWGACLADMPPSPAITKALDRLRKHCARRGDSFTKAYNAMRAALPTRFHTEGDRVSHRVSHTLGHTERLETETKTPTPHQDQRLGSLPETRAREGDPDGPESVGAIVARMAQGAGS